MRTYKLAAVAELADAQDLKSCGPKSSYRFDSGQRHHVCLKDINFDGRIDVFLISMEGLGGIFQMATWIKDVDMWEEFKKWNDSASFKIVF